MDYLSFFGLRSKAFANVCDPEFYYEGYDHIEALNRLIYLVEEGNMGFGVLTGEIGCGKTMTRQVFKSRLDEGMFSVVDFDNSSLDFPYILYEIVLQLSEGDMDPELTPEKPYFLIKAFEYYVQHRNAKLGRNTVLILDEAQLLSDDSLIELKNLTNINSHLSNPLTIVLVGQPELREQVKRLPPLDQRVSLRFHLNPLSAKDVQGYIEQRLRVVGHDTGNLFDFEAIEALTSHTEGIPREVNRACQLCLHFAAAQNRDRVDTEIMDGVIKDLKRQQGDI